MVIPTERSEPESRGTGNGRSPYAPPRVVTSLEDCTFYHTMEVPGFGEVAGSWDLRPGVDAYLGGVSFSGKRVLELGSADGYLTFHIEGQGAEVVSYDLGEDDAWDIVPYARLNPPRPAPAGNGAGGTGLTPSWASTAMVEVHPMRKVNNAYWLAHRALGSNARLVHGDAYSVPPSIGPVDISVFGALLLHTENPFRALRSALELTTDTVVVTDGLGFLRLPAPLRWARARMPHQLRRPIMRFMPDWKSCAGPDGWWRLSPEIVQTFLAVLGFERSEVTTHFQLYNGRRKRLFTVVAHRTVPRS